MTSQAERAHRFRSLHEGEPFVISNPWDAGSARVLAALGFWELATTSSGLAMGLGRRDGQVTLDEVVAHVRALSAATDLPLSVDLEQGHGGSPGDAVRAIRAVAAAGAVGGSIEDWSAASGIDPVERGAERVAAAAEAAHGLDHDFVLTARAENHIRGRDDFDDTISRQLEYERAGAHRVSVGGGLARVAMRAMADPAIALGDCGAVEAFDVSLPLDEWFA